MSGRDAAVVALVVGIGLVLSAFEFWLSEHRSERAIYRTWPTILKVGAVILAVGAVAVAVF